ncbi:hypothetical protein [Pedobacter sandarakinus]|uniref:hypothetical protein n=1 Tax=Pedobacter sandarakinus TaxID=353156 RepID=UPI0022471294|nr:hypothetical protein [Pedobacter sandarakinus]MCX2573096.1 hypothetical protein [Pedobacter sandarakinus]
MNNIRTGFFYDLESKCSITYAGFHPANAAADITCANINGRKYFVGGNAHNRHPRISGLGGTAKCIS